MSNDNKPVFYKPFFLVVIASLAFIFLIAILIIFNNKSSKTAEAPATTATTEKAQQTVEEITAPVGEVTVADASGNETMAAATDASPGKATYDGVCFACHDQGLAGAPKLGDREAWSVRITQGNDTLYDHAINGFTGPSGAMMPAKGGRADIADDDIKAAVDYMIEAAGGTTAAVAEPTAAAPVVEETPAVAEETAAAPTDTAGKGKEVYDSVCFACHAMGVAGAPKLADKEAWVARIAQGNDTLYDHAINGFMGAGLMPPKGGRADLSDDDVKAAVDYMVENSQ